MSHDFKGPATNKLNGGLGRRNPSTDGIGLLVCGGVAASQYVLGTVVKLIQLKDAENLGINAAYDANNAILVHHHISEYFRLHPNGTVFLMVVAQGTTMAEMCDKDEPYLYTAIKSTVAARLVKFAGIVLNPILYSPVTAVAIGTAGTGYLVGDAITATGGSGTGFAAEVATVGGTGDITSITISNNGSGYFTAPTLAVTTAGGAGAVLTATLGDKYVPVVTNGIDEDVLDAVAKAQELVTTLESEDIFMPTVILEGRSLSGTVANYSALRDLAARNVSVVIAADPAIWALDPAYGAYAAVGAALGMLSVRKVSENIGSVNIANKPSGKEADPDYPLTDRANGRWLSAGLSSGVLVNNLTVAELAAISNGSASNPTGKGYIFAGFYEGYDGIYFSDSPTCIELADDYAQIENNRTWAKAAGLVRKALIPKMKGDFDVTSDGYIAPAAIAVWEAAGKKALEGMLSNSELSARDFYIDPKQNVLAGAPIVTKLSITPRGVAREITNDIGFNNPFSN